MRSTVVPAQITTVEDKIAGSLTFPQIILLVAALIIGASIYGGVAPRLHMGSLKLTLIIIQFAFFGILALRFNGKILGEWLVIYLRYSLRARRYIYTKNDLIHREIIFEKEESKPVQAEPTVEAVPKLNSLTLREQIKFDNIFAHNNLSVSFKLSKKGGVDVKLQQAEN